MVIMSGNYASSVAYLYQQLPMYHRVGKAAYKSGLENAYRLDEYFHQPHGNYKTIHVAGTNGKGSVCHMLAAVLQQSGYKVGLHTSPHLVDFRERIKVNGKSCSQKFVIDFVRKHKKIIETIHPSFFEVSIFMAFDYFARQSVDVAIIEVGLGGRLDTTNIITPVLSVITSIGKDHMDFLGDTLDKIAVEKAGIIKPGVPVVLAPQQHEAEHVVARVAEERGAPLIRVGKDWLYAPGVHRLTGQSLYIWSAAEQDQMDVFVHSGGSVEWVPPRFEIPLLGYHQVTNCAVAYAALQVAREQGFQIPEEAIRSGFARASWPGRFQVLSKDPLVILDAAHNRDSALKLRIALDDYFPGQPVTMVFGASVDKDLSGMFDELLPRVSRLIATQAAHARAAEVTDLAALAHGHGTRVETVVPVAQALDRALKILRPDEVLLVTGSLFVVGEALRHWESLGLPTATTQAEVPA